MKKQTFKSESKIGRKRDVKMLFDLRPAAALVFTKAEPFSFHQFLKNLTGLAPFFRLLVVDFNELEI